ncbi:hypothetical protein [Stenotrophomonas sp. YIM B06876]|uniref:hypothetical protein n=1 Tax=Stenotrophomonas sp. YIM B06876 TaxID=3060211 RepID=UPI002739B781|nr:hypothetical protein [Stenotrophomonas sp. YIM B06876]
MDTVVRRASARKILNPLAKVLGVALALSVANAGAVGPVQETGPALAQHFINQLNTYRAQIQQAAQYLKDNTQWATDWAQTLKEYQEALVTVQGVINSFGLPDAASLTPVTPNYLVAETCGAGADMKGLLSYVVFNPEGDWKSQQTQICVNIRMMQNRKYNESVDFMLTTAPSFLDSLDRIANLRFSSNRRGNMDAVASDSLRTANEMNAVAKNFETRIKSYDAYIEVMQANQKIVAQNALKGRSSLASDLVKTVALKMALSID